VSGRILPSRRELHRENVQLRFEAEAAKESPRSAMDELAHLRARLEVVE